MLENGNIAFVCCTDDAARENYIAEHHADDIVVTFADGDYHICSNMLVMNGLYKKMLKDILRTSQSVVVSTGVIDLNVLDSLFIKRVLNGNYKCSAEMLFFCDTNNNLLQAYKPLKKDNGFLKTEYVPLHYEVPAAPDDDKYKRSVELLGKYNDDKMIRLANECFFLTVGAASGGEAAYMAAPYLIREYGLGSEDVAFIQNVVYHLRSTKQKESDFSMAKMRDFMGVRACNALALLKFVYGFLQ